MLSQTIKAPSTNTESTSRSVCGHFLLITIVVLCLLVGTKGSGHDNWPQISWEVQVVARRQRGQRQDLRSAVSC